MREFLCEAANSLSAGVRYVLRGLFIEGRFLDKLPLVTHKRETTAAILVQSTQGQHRFEAIHYTQ